MDKLRSPGGCPWDAEQPAESLLTTFGRTATGDPVFGVSSPYVVEAVNLSRMKLTAILNSTEPVSDCWPGGAEQLPAYQLAIRPQREKILACNWTHSHAQSRPPFRLRPP